MTIIQSDARKFSEHRPVGSVNHAQGVIADDDFFKFRERGNSGRDLQFEQKRRINTLVNSLAFNVIDFKLVRTETASGREVNLLVDKSMYLEIR